MKRTTQLIMIRFATARLWLSLIIGLGVTLGAVNTSAYGSLETAQTEAIETAINASFGSSFETVTAFRPFYVTGDFNGDNVQDLAAVVRLKLGRASWPKDLRVLNPFTPTSGIKVPDNPARENILALAIIHSWKTASASKFILIGESPILILEYNRTKSSPDDARNLIELMSRHGKRRPGMQFPRTAKGDVILLGTEVGGDSMLYWNGRTYRWQDSAED